MGALLSGLIGAAGADIEKQADRAYQEKRQERADRMRILELAMSNPNYDINHLQKDFGELEDISKDAGYKTKTKGEWQQKGAILQKILGRMKQRRAQQAGAQDARTAVAGAPGVTAFPGDSRGGFTGQGPRISPQQEIAGGGQPSIATPPFLPAQGPQGGAPGPLTAPPPPTRLGRFLTREQAEALKEQDFQTGLRRQGQETQASFDQKVKEVDQLVKQGYDKQSAQQIVFGKAAAPAAGKFAPFYISGKNIPPDVEVDALGNKIDRQGDTQYKMEEGNPPKFYPAGAAPRAGGSGDELTKMTKIILAKQGLGGARKPTQQQIEAATQQAGADLFRNKVLNPQERLALTAGTVRTIMGENGLLSVPTHRPGAMRTGPTATGFPEMTPPMPPSRLPQAGGGAAAPPATAPPATGGGAKFVPEVKGAERPRKDNAEIIMGLGGGTIANIGAVAQNHPEWTGVGGMTWQEIQKKFGTVDPAVGTLKGKMDALTGFLPSLHSYRSKSILDEWKRTLDNPLKNPQYTIAVIREIAKGAEEVRNTILKRNVEPMTAAGEEEKAKKAAGGGGGASQAELDYMKKHGIQ